MDKENLRVSATLIVAVEGCPTRVVDIPKEFIFANAVRNDHMHGPNYITCELMPYCVPIPSALNFEERLREHRQAHDKVPNNLYVLEYRDTIGIIEAPNLQAARVSMHLQEKERIPHLRIARMKDIEYVVRNGGCIPHSASKALAMYRRFTNLGGEQ